MIDFQSSLTGVAKRTAINRLSAVGMSSPGEEETGEGELIHRGRQSALMPCPLGTSENSQQHARVIYGWVHSSKETQGPEGTDEIRISKTFFPNEPIFFQVQRKPAWPRLVKVSPASLEEKINFFPRLLSAQFVNCCYVNDNVSA